MIARLDPTLRQITDYFQSARIYYATTRAYSKTAIAGWRGDARVSDPDFVTAAYHASQIQTLGVNGSIWSTIFGTDRLREINNPDLRYNLPLLMTSDYTQFDNAGLDTPYRRTVRRLIPIEIQDAIRKHCGDRHDTLSILTLPQTCKNAIEPADASKAATILRAHAELLEDLQWHIAAIAAFLDNIIPVESATHSARTQLARHLSGPLATQKGCLRSTRPNGYSWVATLHCSTATKDAQRCRKKWTGPGCRGGYRRSRKRALGN